MKRADCDQPDGSGKNYKGKGMTKIHCRFMDCENNDQGMCHAAAVQLDPEHCCLTYQPMEGRSSQENGKQGDSLIWDKEYFEDDPIDDEMVF